LHVLQQQGQEPIRFVIDKLGTHDLLIVDDGLHTAVEPFEFCQQLVKNSDFQRIAAALFLEVVPSNKQRHLEAYLDAQEEDPRLLYPAFQDDANGLGFPYQTYFDLLRTVRAVNRTLSADKRFRVFGVGSPTFWAEIQTPRDWQQFQKSLASYDHHMYVTILAELDGFRSGKKGIFLTNTRHAYKGIKRKDGQYYWNTATFFQQRHPGKTYSIRCHNVALSIQAAKAPSATTAKTAQGLENIEYQFVRMGSGLWDSAFRALGDKPIAFPMAGNVFGQEPYIGNHQLDAFPGQTMQDAYDAVLFLAPLEKLRQTAMTDAIYTPAFREEMKRRYRIMHTAAQLAELLKRRGVADLDELLTKTCVARPEEPLSLARTVGPIDAWKKGAKK
jgi:hypothetical protein